MQLWWQNGHFWPFIGQNGHFWPFLGQNRSFLTVFWVLGGVQDLDPPNRIDFWKFLSSRNTKSPLKLTLFCISRGVPRENCQFSTFCPFLAVFSPYLPGCRPDFMEKRGLDPVFDHFFVEWPSFWPKPSILKVFRFFEHVRALRGSSLTLFSHP